jgi:hypothetical protein
VREIGTDEAARAITGHFGVSEPSYPVSSVQGITGTDRQEVVMSPTVTSIDQIDLEIAVAYIALGSARHAFERCPSGENARVVDSAENSLNDLLDARLIAQQ